jgi:hypothetical protein
LLQFTYGPMSPIARDRLKLDGRVARRVIGNLPPASVWVYRRLGEWSKGDSLKAGSMKAQVRKALSRKDKAESPKAAAIKARRR